MQPEGSGEESAAAAAATIAFSLSAKDLLDPRHASSIAANDHHLHLAFIVDLSRRSAHLRSMAQHLEHQFLRKRVRYLQRASALRGG
jgi:hypothetical protein